MTDQLNIDKALELTESVLHDEKRDELQDGILAWPEPVDGLELAFEIRETYRAYSILPKGADVALTLWSLLTYTYEGFRILPKLCINSPEKRCGKTTTLEVLGAIVHRALPSSNATVSTIFRAIDTWQPTLILDEADTFIYSHEELRGIVNSGHTKSSAFVLRTEGDSKNRRVKRYSTFAPMAIGMIGEPPGTIRDRSITIGLRRKFAGEKTKRLPVEIFRDREAQRRKSKRWADDAIGELISISCEPPKIGNDRAEDNWLPLLTIAKHLGGEWPEIALSAMLELEGFSDDESAGPMILTDIGITFAELGVSRLHSQDLTDHLNSMVDRPWCESSRGAPMTPNGLAIKLKPFGIRPKDTRINGTVKKGYHYDQFEDAFKRYLPTPAIQIATELQPSNHVPYSQIQNATAQNAVAGSSSLKARTSGTCSTVADKSANVGGGP